MPAHKPARDVIDCSDSYTDQTSREAALQRETTALPTRLTQLGLTVTIQHNKGPQRRLKSGLPVLPGYKRYWFKGKAYVGFEVR